MNAAVDGSRVNFGTASADLKRYVLGQFALDRDREIAMDSAVHGRYIHVCRIIRGNGEMDAAVGCRNIQPLPAPTVTSQFNMDASVDGARLYLAAKRARCIPPFTLLASMLPSTSSIRIPPFTLVALRFD